MFFLHTCGSFCHDENEIVLCLPRGMIIQHPGCLRRRHECRMDSVTRTQKSGLAKRKVALESKVSEDARGLSDHTSFRCAIAHENLHSLNSLVLYSTHIGTFYPLTLF